MSSSVIQGILLVGLLGAGFYVLSNRFAQSGGGLLGPGTPRDNRTGAEKFFGAVQAGANAGQSIKNLFE